MSYIPDQTSNHVMLSNDPCSQKSPWKAIPYISFFSNW